MHYDALSIIRTLIRHVGTIWGKPCQLYSILALEAAVSWDLWHSLNLFSDNGSLHMDRSPPQDARTQRLLPSDLAQGWMPYGRTVCARNGTSSPWILLRPVLIPLRSLGCFSTTQRRTRSQKRNETSNLLMPGRLRKSPTITLEKVSYGVRAPDSSAFD